MYITQRKSHKSHTASNNHILGVTRVRRGVLRDTRDTLTERDRDTC